MFPLLRFILGGGGPLGGVFSFNEPDGSTIDYLANCVMDVVGSDNHDPASDSNNADEIVASFIANAARGEVCGMSKVYHCLPSNALNYSAYCTHS